MEYLSQKMFWSPLNGFILWLVFYRDIPKVGISTFNISELRRGSINFPGFFYLFPWHWDVKHLSMIKQKRINVITITDVRIYKYGEGGRGDGMGTADV
jgi:hypothetical protein